MALSAVWVLGVWGVQGAKPPKNKSLSPFSPQGELGDRRYTKLSASFERHKL